MKHLPNVLKNAPLSIIMDHVRWIAAFLVLISHIRYQLFKEFAEIEAPSYFEKAFYFLTRFGHESVILFFVLSGALVGGKFADRTKWGEIDFKFYAVARLTRLYIVLIPAILWTISITSASSALLGKHDTNDLSTKVILGNTLFLQDILVPLLSFNHPLWSLANEFWYYTLTPLAVGLCLPIKTRIRLTIATILCAVIVMLILFDSFDYKNVLLYFPIWLMGILVHFKWFPQISIWIALPLFAIAAFLSRVGDGKLNFYIMDVALCLSFLLFLIAVRDRVWSRRAHILLQDSSWIGVILSRQSYSLYLIHFPLCIAANRYFFEFLGRPRFVPDGTGISLFLLLTCVSYAIAEVFYRLFESKAKRIQQFLNAMLATKQGS